jgi:beta-lactamase regulating signal transducer with metallopeptidase domain/tetratricopeptide (TPR) repeat protein
MATIFELAARLQSANVAEELLLILAKATLILLIARLLLAAMPRAAAATKHLVATAALVAVACMPLMSVLVPAWNVVVATKAAPAVQKNAASQDGTIGVVDGESIGIAKTFAKAIAPAPLTAVERVTALVRSSWKGMLVILALLVAMLMLGHMLAGMIGVWRIARDARPVEDDIALVELDRARDQLALRADVRLLQSERVTVPIVWGVFRPVLLLPVEASEWSSDKLRVVLLHELAHLKRVDGISLILTRIAVSLFWFHPVAWSLERAGRSECERACDDLVLAGGTKPSEYADHLLEIARTMPASDPYRAVTLAMSRKSQLEGRLLSILQPGGARRAFGGRTVAFACVLAVAVIVPVSALRLIAQQAPEMKVTETQKKEQIRSDSTIEVKPHVDSLEGFLAKKLDEYGIDHDLKKNPPQSASDWYDHAHHLYRRDRFAEAGEAFLRSAEKSKEPEPTALYNAACSFALAGDAGRASQALTNALENGWDDIDRIAEDSDFDPIRSDKRFHAVVAKYGSDVTTRRETRALVRYEDLRAGRRIERRGDKAKDKERDEWYSVGLDLLRLRRFDQSIDAFERSIARNEKNSAAAYNIACAHALRGDVRSGLQWLDTAVEQGFGDDEKLRNDPDLASLRGEPQFRTLLQKARDLEMRFTDRWQWDDAVAHHKQMTVKYPNSGRAWFNYGYTSLQARDFQNAVNAFRKTASMEYKPGTSAYNIACAHALQGNVDAAFEWLQRAEASGFKLAQYLDEDEDLDALRGDPRFKALSARLSNATAVAF